MASIASRDFYWGNSASERDDELIEQYSSHPENERPRHLYTAVTPWITADENELFGERLRNLEPESLENRGLLVQFTQLSEDVATYIENATTRQRSIAVDNQPPENYRTMGLNAKKTDLESKVAKFRKLVSAILDRQQNQI